MKSRSRIATITGRHHPLVKMVRGMARSGELRANGQVLLETPNLIEDALASSAAIPTVLVSSSANPAARKLLQTFRGQTEIFELPSNLFASLTTTENSPGILALAEAPVWEEAALFSKKPPLLVVLAGVQDPGNLGTILRTAEAFAATGIILTRGTVSPYNAKAIRAASGALFRLPVLQGLASAQIVSLLRDRKVPLLASVAKGGRLLHDTDLRGPAAIAFGSEGAGLPRELEQAGISVSIPMARQAESLNVAAAAAVILYEIVRQRRAVSGTARANKQPV
jgi:TrmH family RNA methyltransferase